MESNNAQNCLFPTLLSVASAGTELVASITQYLSTIPTPVEILEDLASIVAVTSSLLTSLDTTILQYSLLSADKLPFVRLLCLDVEAVFENLKVKVEEARLKRVFEPNEKGLVRTPKFSWFDIVGSEGKAAALRCRLCIEKYRVRVLIDAVKFKGLSDLNHKCSLRTEEVVELSVLKQMLPVIVVRLVGVQKDYLPRLRGSVIEVTDNDTPLPEKGVEKTVLEKDKIIEAEVGQLTTNLKASSSSSKSVASSVTIVDDSIEEAWLLRKNESEHDLKKAHYICGIKFWATYQYKASSFYVKALAASKTEIKEMRESALGDLSQSAHEEGFKKTILEMNDKAQWEIQKLLESRDKASSTDRIKRSWEVVAFQARPRRKITDPARRKWWNKGKKPMVEWVLILRGETVDHEKRVTPVKHESPWKEKEKKEKKPAKSSAIPHKTGDILTHIENRNFMSMEEAEKKMKDLLMDLFEIGAKPESA